MMVQPYLFFNGRCEEAITFYQTALGAKITHLMRFKDNPEGSCPDNTPPGSAEKIMHCSLRIGDAEVMASDGNCSGRAAFQGMSLALLVTDEAEADRLFNALGQGGAVEMAIGKTFFSSRFGIVTDRFGVSWMVVAPPAS